MKLNEIVEISNAAKAGDYKKIDEILSQEDFDVNQAGRCGWTPLHAAIDQKDFKLAETFKEAYELDDVEPTSSSCVIS